MVVVNILYILLHHRYSVLANQPTLRHLWVAIIDSKRRRVARDRTFLELVMVRIHVIGVFVLSLPALPCSVYVEVHWSNFFLICLQAINFATGLDSA